MTPTAARKLVMQHAHNAALVDKVMGRGYRTNWAAHMRNAWAYAKRQQGTLKKAPPVVMLPRPAPASPPTFATMTPAQRERFLLEQKTRLTNADWVRLNELRNL